MKPGLDEVQDRISFIEDLLNSFHLKGGKLTRRNSESRELPRRGNFE